MAYVYRHVRLDTNQVFYIGVGRNDDRAYRRAHAKCGRNAMWRGVVNKSPIFIEILIENVSLEYAFEKEIEFIALYRRKMDGGTLVNITTGGDGVPGVPLTDETRRKLSLAKIGKPSPRKGKTHSAETKKLISLVSKGRIPPNKGKKMKAESIEKLRKSLSVIDRSGKNHPMWGRKMPEDHLQKMIEGSKRVGSWNKGKKMSDDYLRTMRLKNKSQQKQIIQCDESGLIVAQWNSATFACIINQLPKSSVCKCANRGRGKVGGYTWRYNHQVSVTHLFVA